MELNSLEGGGKEVINWCNAQKIFFLKKTHTALIISDCSQILAHQKFYILELSNQVDSVPDQLELQFLDFTADVVMRNDGNELHYRETLY